MGKEFWANLILGVCLVSLAIFALANFGSALTPKGLFVGDPHPTAAAKAKSKEVFLVQHSMIKDVNKRFTANFKVQNTGKEDVENVEVLCEFYGDDNTYLDQKTWLLGTTFPAGEETSYSPPQERYINFGATVKCSIIDLQVAKAPAFTLHRAEGGGHDGGHDEDHGGGHGHAPAASGH